MKKTLFLLLLPLWLTAQTSNENKITFKEGETARFGLNVSGLETITRVEVTFRNTLGSVVRKFSTLDTTVTLVADTLYTFAFTDLQSIGKSGRGTWQVEIRSETGVKKTDVYTYEIYKATTNTSSTTPVNGNGYNYLFEWDFTPVTPTFNVIESGLILVDNASISDALDLKLNISDTTVLLRKTTAAGLYVAKAVGGSLFLDAERTKLAGVAANAVDAAGVRATPLTGLSTASSALVTSSSTQLQAIGQLQAQNIIPIYATHAAAVLGLAGRTTSTRVEITADETAGNTRSFYQYLAHTGELIFEFLFP